MTHRRMAQILARMSVLSEVQAVQHGDVVHGGEKNRQPRGPRVSMHEEHARAFLRANGPMARAEVLRAAEEALIRAQHSPRRQYVPGTLEWRVAIARAAGSVEQVSIVFGCSRQTVYRCREQFGTVAVAA